MACIQFNKDTFELEYVWFNKISIKRLKNLKKKQSIKTWIGWIANSWHFSSSILKSDANIADAQGLRTEWKTIEWRKVSTQKWTTTKKNHVCINITLVCFHFRTIYNKSTVILCLCQQCACSYKTEEKKNTIYFQVLGHQFERILCIKYVCIDMIVWFFATWRTIVGTFWANQISFEPNENIMHRHTNVQKYNDGKRH